MKNEDIVIPERSEKEIIETWEKMGLLKDLEYTEKKTAAIYYEKAAMALIKWDDIKYEFDNAAFAIIYKLAKRGYKFDNFNISEIYAIYCNEYEKSNDPKIKDRVANAAAATCDYFAKTENKPKIK
jgi:hypothetical protein